MPITNSPTVSNQGLRDHSKEKGGTPKDDQGEGMSDWQPIETAPRDGTRFWGNVDDDAIAMLWHEGFGEFVSSWRRMEMAAGYTIDGAAYKDHSPVVHNPTHWMPLPKSPSLSDQEAA